MLGLLPQVSPAVQLTQAPLPSHTRLLPQLVPADFGAPSLHTVVPVPQVVVPCRQTLGLPPHAWPAVQLPQKPAPSHTWPLPQLVPAPFGAPSTHVCVPVVQEVTPLAHAALGLVLHDAPLTQLMQLAALLQTWLVPQLVPAALGVESRHTGAPVVQEMAPFAHAALGLVLQLCPAVQLTQLPALLQTWLLPQLVPGALALPFSQVRPPVAQDATPVKQGLGLVLQLPPAVHATHSPAGLHTWLVPQLLPTALGAESRHTDAPVMHEVTPVRHESGLVVHGCPDVQPTHWPLGLHTWLLPHVVPGGLGAESAQTWLPVSQAVSPVRHTLVLVVQLVPALQPTQLPLALQTWLTPQVVPTGFDMPSTHMVPDVQLMTPSLQAPGLLVQLVPALHAPQKPFPSHTSAPHETPAALLPESTHVCAPV